MVITSPADSTTDTGPVHVCRRIAHWDFGAAREVLRLLRDADVEVANVQYPTQEYGRRLMANMLPWLIHSRLGLPTVATIHEYSSFTALGRMRLALTARLSQAVVVTDATNRRLLRRWAGGQGEKYSLIRIGSNLPCSPPASYDRSAFRASLGASSSSVVLVYFGFISPSKGLHTLLEAFAEALEVTPGVDLRLWLLADRQPAVARYRSYHAAFAQRLANFAHADRVVWTGYLEPAEVSAHLLAADLAVLPFRDGASMRRGSLLATLDHGLPVISSQGPSAGRNGLGAENGLCLVPAGDAHALARTILTLARDAELRARLGERASEFARTFSWPQIAARTLAVYEQALGRPERRARKQ